MESDWVKLCPYLEVIPPHPLYSEKDNEIKEIVEIRDFFTERNKEDYMIPFLDYFLKLPMIPSENQSKIQQVLKSIRLMKVANKVQKSLEEMGVQSA